MSEMVLFWTGLSSVALLVWLGLLGFWGQFWRADQRLPPRTKTSQNSTPYPPVWVVVPARNEADLLPLTLQSLLSQDYEGFLGVIVVDDQSVDGTAETAWAIAQDLNRAEHLQVLTGEPLPVGWTGKLWAVDQGIRHARQQTPTPAYLLLTDADIEHDRNNVGQLVAQAQEHQLDLTSLMVLLRCQSLWERLLIPAFIFFFQKLYPFPWVNEPQRRLAAAAGGCLLIRPQALDRIGGLASLGQALIDDCTLAQSVKSSGGAIWLGLSISTRSLRPYPSLSSIWTMVARTAYTQLNYSPWALLGTVLGMALVYGVAPISLGWGLITGHGWVAILGGITWLLMALAYWPTLQLYRGSPPLAFCLPLIALMYTLMTLDSARRHWQGQGGAWKGRVYGAIGR